MSVFRYKRFVLLAFFFHKSKVRDMESFQIERKSSIESEPRTLHFGQIQCAREAALYVLNTKSIEEALRIFTEGLQPVVSAKENNAMDSGDEWDYVASHLTIPPVYTPGSRDVVTAPF
ncbi:uncharacterized protein LOC131236530 [Magnolia sinica]|uniref:uncharacterized protein LOC131236530 n=1 Tax=Magnolia sinica TaxID=86752 RepID=UPI00265A28BD|nr:uncharacterized protein LOC131236530 [Magnolia sinica]